MSGDEFFAAVFDPFEGTAKRLPATATGKDIGDRARPWGQSAPTSGP